MKEIEVGGLRLTVRSFDQVSASPVETWALDVSGKLLRQGWIPAQCYCWDDHAIALFERDEVRAFICFREVKHHNQVQISLGAVDPGYHRRGLYRALFAELVAHVRRQFPKAAAISSGYHVGNKSSAAMSAGLGRAVTHHVTTFPIEASADA